MNYTHATVFLPVNADHDIKDKYNLLEKRGIETSYHYFDV
jgi:hypothetical protein